MSDRDTPCTGASPGNVNSTRLSKINRVGAYVAAGLVPLGFAVNLVSLLRGEGARGHFMLAPSELAIGFLAALALVEFLLERGSGQDGGPGTWEALKRDPFPAVPVLVLLLIPFVGVIAGIGSFSSSAKDGAQLFGYLVVGTLYFSYASRRADVRLMISVFIASTSLVVLVACAQYFGGRREPLVSGVFGNRAMLGAFLAMSLPLAASLAMDSGSAKWVRICAGVLTAAGLLVVLYGGALAAAIAGILVAAALMGKRELAAAAVLSCAVLLLGPAFLPRDTLAVSASSLDGIVEDSAGRVKLGTAARRRHAELKLVASHPVLGCGAGGYRKQLPVYYADEFPKLDGATDDVAEYGVLVDEPGTFGLYAVAACETGLPGLIALAWVMVSFLVPGLSATAGEKSRRNAFAAGVAGGILGCAVVNAFTSTFVSGVGFTAALLFGLAVAFQSRRHT